MNPLRVVHISTSDIGGGAAIASYRLHKGLLRLGVDSQMVVSQKQSDDYTVHGPSSNTEKLWSRLANQLDQVPRRFLKTPNSSLISPAWILENTIDRALALKPDVINLHWIGGGFVRPESLRRLETLPVVWTLHDMWAFSGGEHYVGNDERYKIGYEKENRPLGETGLDLNRWVWQRKMGVVPRLQKLTVVTDSTWLGNCARESMMFRNHRVVAINYGLDADRFKPIPKDLARYILGVPSDKKVILFGAINAVNDPRKGIDLLAAALKHLAAQSHQNVGNVDDNIECYVFGSSTPRKPQDFGFPTHYLGALSDELALAIIYAAADVMVVPSREEAFGQTALEALACGTPVVAFNIGGLPDTVEHERNGYLARPFDIADIANGIQWVLSDEERRKMLSHNARAKVENGFTLEHQARRYIEVYSHLLTRK